MEITDEMIDYIAVLSRLSLPDEERAQVRRDLGSIIGYMDVLNNIHTEDIEPLSHVFEIKNVFREDVVAPSFDREELLKNAPKRDGESFLVPKTVE